MILRIYEIRYDVVLEVSVLCCVILCSLNIMLQWMSLNVIIGQNADIAKCLHKLKYMLNRGSVLRNKK